MGVQIKNLLWFALLASSAVFDQVSSLQEQKTCKPVSARNSSVNDVPAIREALSTCGNGGTIIISAGETFMIRSPLVFSNCTACDFQIEGTLKVSEDLHYWEHKTIFVISNVSGATFHSLTGSGLIDGSGQKYWDYFARNKTYSRPFLIHFSNTSNTTFTKLKLKDSPSWFIYIIDGSTKIQFSDLILSAISNSSSEPINTDGIDTGDCSHITISNVHITNDDDCVCFKNGSNYITATNITCVGSRGISVGSLGESPGLYTVKNVYVSNVKMINSTSAARIKVFAGGPSHGQVVVSNVTILGVTVDNCDFAFRVQNCYEQDTSTCKNTPSAAILSDIKIIDFTGKTSSKYDPDVANIDCPPKGTCDLTFVGWDVVAPSKNATVLCDYYDHPSGVKCTHGAFG
jgi:galacturan 1,4-alpha-galacturonidase